MSEITSTEATSTEAETVTPVAPVESVAEATDGQGDTSGTDTVDRAAYDALRAELDAFKRDVVVITGRYAEAHNLCGVTDQALAELGLRRVQTGHRVTVTFTASWDVKSSSRGRAGAPSDSNVWSQVESLAATIRYDGVESTQQRNKGDRGTWPNLSLDASVKVETAEPGPDAHLIPPVHRFLCPACEHQGSADTDGTCRNCGEELTDDMRM